MPDPPLLLYVASLLQVLVACANVPAIWMFGYRESMRRVPQHVSQVFWVQNAYLVLTVLGLAAACATFPRELAGGSPLGRGISGFLAVFWGTRLAIQLFAYSPELRRRYRTFDVLFVLTFAYLTALFGAAAAGLLAPA